MCASSGTGDRPRAAAAALILLLVLLAVAPLAAVAGVGAGGATAGAAGAGAVAGPAAGGTVAGGSAAAAAAAGLQDGPNPCVGTVERRPSNTTLVSIQGALGSDKTVAMTVGVHPNGSVVGVHDDTEAGRWWSYDADPMANGNLLLATTEPGVTVIEEVDPDTGEHVSVRQFPDLHDTHDADLINGDELLMNDMSQDGEDRVVVYNLTREEIVWEYRFADHPEEFPHEGGGNFEEDWTHNNDVEKIGDGTYMVSVRNFDQVVAIDRETKEVVWRLGGDDDHDVLFEQHNPDYLEGANGTPTVLVADSRNDRVVEYARDDGEWVRTWSVSGGLVEPRDADRLPNGNTLIADRRGHRVVEVTPTGEVVWEFDTPYQPYDVERVGTGDESAGPTARQIGAVGDHEMTGDADHGEQRIRKCYEYLTEGDVGSGLVPADEAFAPETAGGTPTPAAGADYGTPATDGRAGDPGDDGGLGSPLVPRLRPRTIAAGGAALFGLLAAAAWLVRR